MGKSCRDFSTSIPGFCLPPLPSQQRTPGGGRRRGGAQGLTLSLGRSEEYNIPKAIGHCQPLWLTQKGDLGAGRVAQPRDSLGAARGAGDTAVPPAWEVLLVWGQPGHLGELQSVHGCWDGRVG